MCSLLTSGPSIRSKIRLLRSSSILSKLTSNPLTVVLFGLTLLSVFVTDILYSHPLKYHKIRKLGVGHLTINIEGKEADMNFIATSLDVFWFEKEPAKTDKEGQKAVDKFREHIKENAEKMVIFDPDLGCQTKAYVLSTFIGEHETEDEKKEPESGSTSSFKMTAEEEARWEKELKNAPKADIYLRMHAVCKKPFTGKVIKFGLTTVFPKVAKVEMHLIDGKKTLGRFIRKNKGTITP